MIKKVYEEPSVEIVSIELNCAISVDTSSPNGEIIDADLKDWLDD